jgi:bacteriorhodopsin
MLDDLTPIGKWVTVLVMLIFVVIGYTLGAHTTQYLWKWYIAPLTGLPLIGFMQAIGLRITINWLTGIEYVQEADDLEIYYKRLINSCITYPLVTLFLGWILISLDIKEVLW